MKIARTPLGREISIVRPWRGKRLADILFASLALLLLFPIMFIVAIAVRVTSPGPILYCDRRLGLGGGTYEMLKFRSMKHKAPPVLNRNGKLVVTRTDPRLTPVGRLLRILHLDEIPQLINVIRGDMAFVGPRSGQPQYEHLYNADAYERLRVRPGITGLAAVVGGRHIDNESLYAVEAAYVRHQSPLLDAMIVICTPIYVLAGHRIIRRLLSRYLGGLNLVDLDSTDEH